MNRPFNFVYKSDILTFQPASIFLKFNHFQIPEITPSDLQLVSLEARSALEPELSLIGFWPLKDLTASEDQNLCDVGRIS